MAKEQKKGEGRATILVKRRSILSRSAKIALDNCYKEHFKILLENRYRRKRSSMFWEGELFVADNVFWHFV